MAGTQSFARRWYKVQFQLEMHIVDQVLVDGKFVWKSKRSASGPSGCLTLLATPLPDLPFLFADKDLDRVSRHSLLDEVEVRREQRR